MKIAFSRGERIAMGSNLIDALQDMGVDTQAALRRFAGNSALYERFLMKFLEDGTFKKVEDAFKTGDWDSMLSAAHNFKGVAGNLGLNQLYQASSKIVSSLRAENRNDATEAYMELDIAYRALRPVLESATGGGAR